MDKSMNARKSVLLTVWRVIFWLIIIPVAIVGFTVSGDAGLALDWVLENWWHLITAVSLIVMAICALCITCRG